MILYIDACVRRESRTERLARALLQEFDDEIREVRLEEIPFDVSDEAFLERRDRLIEAGAFDHDMFSLARQFAAADMIVIAAPYWDLSFPASLKQYMEKVTVNGLTFEYTPEGIPRGLCRAEKLYYIMTAGGDYIPEEFGFGYIKALAEGYYGIRDVRLIKAAGLDIVGADPDQILDQCIRDQIRGPEGKEPGLSGADASGAEQAPASDRACRIYDRFRARASRDDEYKDWTEYRSELTDFIVSNTKPGASLLILGAGKCNDLDLRKLAEHAGSMTLSDYRPETAEEAFRGYGLTPSAHLGFRAADYVGITDRDYMEYTDLLLSIMQKLAGTPAHSLEAAAGPELDRLGQTLEEIYGRNADYRIDLGGAVYDYAVVAGVHSQLNNAFRGIFQYVRKDVEDSGDRVRFAEELNKYIFEITRKHTVDLVDRFNAAVFAAAGKGVIYGYEENIIYTPEGARGPVIGTVDGARQAGEAIADRPVETYISCLWPLSRRRGIKYEMTICFLKQN